MSLFPLYRNNVKTIIFQCSYKQILSQVVEFLKKKASALNRAMAELRSNGTDNNKGSRGPMAEGVDKREELKRALFESGEAFEALSLEKADDKKKTKASAEVSRPAQNMARTAEAPRPAQNMVRPADAPRPAQNMVRPADAPRFAQSMARPAEAPRPAQNMARPAEAPRPAQNMARPADALRPEQSMVRPADAPRPAQSMARPADAPRPAQSMARPADASRPAQNMAQLMRPMQGVAPVPPMQPMKQAPAQSKKKKGVLGKVIAVVASFMIVAVAGVGAFMYFGREEDVVPADLVAGNAVIETAGYSKLMSDTAIDYLTTERYNVKFTFYEKPEVICTTKETTVGELMEKLGITVGEDNRCSMTADAVLSSDSTVDIQTITYETAYKEEAVPFETTYVDIQTIPKGSTKVRTEGKNGVKTYTYKCTLVNGVEESRELVGEAVTTRPRTKVLYRGVGGTITSQGKTYKYSYYIDVKATVYNIVGNTASGLPTSTSVMAVDPKVIPLGTKCVVTGISGDYGYRIAADTGGNIKGNKIDLWYPAGTFNGFGWRSTRVYILE